MAETKRWIKIPDQHTAQWGRMKHPQTGRECNGILYVGAVDLTDCLPNHDSAALHRVREMIDIIRLLAMAYPALLAQLIRLMLEKWGELEEKHPVVDAIARRVPLTVTFELQIDGNHTSDLTPWLTDFFSNDPVQFVNYDGRFAAERRRLIQSLSKSQWQYLESHPTEVTLVISPEQRTDLQALDSEDFFANLGRFAVEANRAKQTPPHDRSDSYLPIRLQHVSMSLQTVWFTPRVIETAMNLAHTGIPVKLTSINLDPRYLHCSADELRSFLDVVTTVESDVQVLIGRENAHANDDRGQDRSNVLGIIAHAVNGLRWLHDIDMGRLLKMFTSRGNRRIIIRELVLPLLSRPTPLSTFAISLAALTREDIDGLHVEAAEWRRRNPGKLLRVKSLVLVVRENEPSVLNAVAMILDDAEEVKLFSSSHGRSVATATMRTLLRYPSLKSFRVRGCIIESMDLFDPLIAEPDLPVKPLLRSLSLSRFILIDRPSMQSFLGRLADPSHPLTKSLQSLTLAADTTEMYSLDLADLQLLSDVLRCNRILAQIDVWLAPVSGRPGEPDSASFRRQVKPLGSTNQRSVPDLEGRQTEEFKGRTRALLSVVRSELPAVPVACRQLDAAVLSLIIDFSAPHSVRKISVSSLT